MPPQVIDEQRVILTSSEPPERCRDYPLPSAQAFREQGAREHLTSEIVGAKAQSSGRLIPIHEERNSICHGTECFEAPFTKDIEQCRH